MKFTYSSTANMMVKMNQRVEIKEVMQLVNLRKGKEVNNYQLYSAICHRGDLHSGHYFAYCFKNGWYLFDDSAVAPIPSKDKMMKEICKNGYILIYRKMEP
mmetsp:Transcript_31450/g.30796  ORF Transcript_31450/g.30796 Transcript_31450/m.30796 type:complete len:101 (+) Transcript_31450:286-588(+)